jgi:hypothetical protein
MEPSKPHENDKTDLHDALEVLAWLEEREIKDKRGYVTGYRIEEGLDQKAMMRAVVIFGRMYRDRINIPQLCKDRGVEAKVVTAPIPFPAPPVVGGELLQHPIHTRLRVPLNAPAHKGRISFL